MSYLKVALDNAAAAKNAAMRAENDLLEIDDLVTAVKDDYADLNNLLCGDPDVKKLPATVRKRIGELLKDLEGSLERL